MKVIFSSWLRKSCLTENSVLYIQIQIIALSSTSLIENDLTSAHSLLLLMIFTFSWSAVLNFVCFSYVFVFFIFFTLWILYIFKKLFPSSFLLLGRLKSNTTSSMSLDLYFMFKLHIRLFLICLFGLLSVSC